MGISDIMLSNLLSETRDIRRPTMEQVLEVIDSAFGSLGLNIGQVTAGPPSWVWEDRDMVDSFPKFYVLTESLEYPSYPLFTIRQAYSVRFDTWVSMSGLVIGPDASGITRSIAMSMAHHAGAFAGIKFVAGTITRNHNVPIAGMAAVQMLMESPPPVIEADQIESLVSEADGVRDGKDVN